MPAAALPDLPDLSARWETDALDLDAYLRRIQYDGPRVPSLAVLRELQRAHLQAIPFENLDVMAGIEVRLDMDSLQDKLVRRGRGGYCHEHNILFATVLSRLGFEVAGRNARILMGDDERRLTPLGHTMLAVFVEGRAWHVDVGVGNIGPREPMPLEDGVQVDHDGWRYRIDRGPGGRWVLRHLRDDGWFNVYQFTDETYYRVDYGEQNFLVMYHPDSPFHKQIIVQYNGAESRYALTGRQLKTWRPGRDVEQREISDSAFPSVLEQVFGLEIDSAQLGALLKRLDEPENPKSQGEGDHGPTDERDHAGSQ
ncbi:arylamine N-acetyltransferase family protein [Aquisalimonas asiatica]|uniref:N-hydroxyarylamine O-acetyltransferase n=1 Tax=Aquisalimonas asiatica TaxID=406100 RepID=A0A1H8Q143_9GAMM|nr:arylamine N-acetyltransferase [Aquisalimonas asiatica]SEO47503.1 N-hydroxyarylamine O-acetyltransferase [Aquisalimonas asiatica]